MEASSPCNPCTLPRLFFLLATFYRAYTLQFPVNSSFSVPRNFRSKSLEEKKAERRKTVSSETSVVQARPSHVCLGRSHFSWRRGSKDAATLLGEMHSRLRLKNGVHSFCHLPTHHLALQRRNVCEQYNGYPSMAVFCDSRCN